jgi:hypothetical protein
MAKPTKQRALIAHDGTRDADVLTSLVRQTCDGIDINVPPAGSDVLRGWTRQLVSLAEAASEAETALIYLPIRLEGDDALRAAEWQQTAEDHLRHGLGFAGLRFELPLLELDDRRLEELANGITGRPVADAA